MEDKVSEKLTTLNIRNSEHLQLPMLFEQSLESSKEWSQVRMNHSSDFENAFLMMQ
jgi:hypothetical protein